MQHTSNIPASHAEHLLCDLRCHSLQSHGGGAPGALARGVREVPGVQFEAEAFKVLVLSVGYRVSGPSHLMEGHPT